MFNFFKNLFAKSDVNKDGKTDVQDLKAAAQPVVEQVKEAAKPLDVNHDGKVDLADAKAAVKQGAAKAKARVGQVKEQVKAQVKKRTPKPRSKT